LVDRIVIQDLRSELRRRACAKCDRGAWYAWLGLLSRISIRRVAPGNSCGRRAGHELPVFEFRAHGDERHAAYALRDDQSGVLHAHTHIEFISPEGAGYCWLCSA